MAGSASVMDVMKFFAYDTAAEFRKDWGKLTETDKTQLKTGIGNGTLTY